MAHRGMVRSRAVQEKVKPWKDHPLSGFSTSDVAGEPASTVVNTPAIGEAPADVRRASDQHHGRRHG